MILDNISNAKRYFSMHKGFEKAFTFLNQDKIRDFENGKYEIDSDRIFAIVSKEKGRELEGSQLEAHNSYIDIQMVFSGMDQMGWKSRSVCKNPSTEYHEGSDIQFFQDAVDHWFTVNKNEFAIFFPEDAHLPAISDEIIHKIVVKIKNNI